MPFHRLNSINDENEREREREREREGEEEREKELNAFINDTFPCILSLLSSSKNESVPVFFLKEGRFYLFLTIFYFIYLFIYLCFFMVIIIELWMIKNDIHDYDYQKFNRIADR